MQTIDELRLSSPLLFEWIEQLSRDRAAIHREFFTFRERLEEREEPYAEQVQRKIREAYWRMRETEESIRRELDAIAKRIADMAAMMPLEPIVVPASSAQHPPALET